LGVRGWGLGAREKGEGRREKGDWESGRVGEWEKD